MKMLIVLTLCAVLVGVLGEPPSSYLPPQARASLSSTYGPPNGESNQRFRSNGKANSFHSQRTGSKSFSYNSLHESQFGGSQSRKSFGGFNGAPSQQYGAPSQSYKAPGLNGNGRNGNGYNGNGHNGNGYNGNGRNGNGFSSSQQYSAPRNGFGASSGNGFGVSQQYGAPNFEAFSSNKFGVSQQYGVPASSNNGFDVSQQYGAPAFGALGNGFGGSSNGFSASQRFKSSGVSSYKSSNGNGKNGGYPAPVYGAPSSRYGAPYSKMDDDLSEPANYEYTYEVQAAEESGAEFGHQESREDESARGVYHVLLPDGRTQIVEYEADEEGFRPVIRYEEPTGYPAARGPQGPY